MSCQKLKYFLSKINPADVLLLRVALAQVPSPPELRVAKDGEQALALLNSADFQPQLIILDLNMPRMDGEALLRQYRRPNIPVVIFSSTQDRAEVQRALALGAREYVQKPIGFEPYADAVRGILDRWIPERAEAQFNPL